MRLSIGILAAWCVTILLLALPAKATVVGQEWVTCPACGQKFSSAMVEGSTSVGGDEEGRPVNLGMDTQEFRLLTCPHCHYSGFMYDFDGHQGTPVGPVMQKVRDALAKNSGMLPAGALWPLERVKAAETCYLAQSAAAYRLEQLYRLGGWLADDAGEDDLALEYRKKAAAEMVRAVRLSGQAGDDYSAAIAAYWTGDFGKAATLFKSAGVGLAAHKLAFQKQWLPVRDGILRRIDAKNADPKAPPETQPAEITNDNLDWDSILDEAKGNESILVRERLAMEQMADNIESLQGIAELGALGQKIAYEKALAGDIRLRRQFLFAFGRRPNAEACKQIEAMIRIPDGDAKGDAAHQAAWLRLAWGQIGGGSSMPEVPAASVEQLITQLKETSTEKARVRENVINALVQAATPAAAAGLLNDLEARPAAYDADFPLVSGNATVPWKTIAIDAIHATDLAKRRLSNATAWAAAVTLWPLAFCTDEASLTVLHDALADKHSQVCMAAAECLIVRKKHEGVSALISIATADDSILPKLEPNLATIFVSQIGPSDALALLRLRDKWPRPIERKDDDTKAMAAVVVRAALAKANGQKFMQDYNDAVDELLASKISGHESAQLPWDDTVPEKMKLLEWCGNIYFTPHIDGLLRPMLKSGISEFGVATMIQTLARNGTQEENDVLAEQMHRPVPMMVKLALIDTIGKLQIKGQEATVARWAKSTHPRLSQAAQKAGPGKF